MKAFFFTLALMTCTASFACPSLAVLAGFEGRLDHDSFTKIYEHAIAEIEQVHPLTDHEREALRLNPFVLPDTEGGRTQAKDLLAAFAKAFSTLSESERKSFLISRRTLPAPDGRTEKETKREAHAPTVRSAARPEAIFVAANGTLQVFHVFEDGHRLLFGNGSLAVEMDDPNRPLVARSIPLVHSKTKLHQDGEWAIAWPKRELGDVAPPPPMWVSADPRHPPKTSVPIPALENVRYRGPNELISEVHLAQDGSRFVTESNKYTALVFPSVHSATPIATLQAVNLFRVTADGKLLIARPAPDRNGPDVVSLFTPGVGDQLLPIGLHSTGLAFGSGPRIGTEHILAPVREPGPSLSLFAVDSKTGTTTSVVEYDPHRLSKANLLGHQPVWLNVRTQNGTFEIDLMSKTEARKVAFGKWKGTPLGVTSSVSGAKIVVAYKRSDGQLIYETYDTAEWIRLGNIEQTP